MPADGGVPAGGDRAVPVVLVVAAVGPAVRAAGVRMVPVGRRRLSTGVSGLAGRRPADRGPTAVPDVTGPAATGPRAIVRPVPTGDRPTGDRLAGDRPVGDRPRPPGR